MNPINHVAIIMDGNGRWGLKYKKSRNAGHKAGLNPQIDGQLVRLPVPELNEERRTELKKLIKAIGEKCKVSIRNIRREANEDLKKLLKSKEIGEDEEKSFEKNVQNITDKHISIVEEKVSSKEKEIMTI